MLREFKGIKDSKELNGVVKDAIGRWMTEVPTQEYIECFMFLKMLLSFLTTARCKLPAEQNWDSVVMLLEAFSLDGYGVKADSPADITLEAHILVNGKEQDIDNAEWVQLYHALKIGDAGHMTHTVGLLLRWIRWEQYFVEG